MGLTLSLHQTQRPLAQPLTNRNTNQRQCSPTKNSPSIHAGQPIGNAQRTALTQMSMSVRPSIRERHVASATPIDVPLFSIDAKVPAETGYIGIRDPKAT